MDSNFQLKIEHQDNTPFPEKRVQQLFHHGFAPREDVENKTCNCSGRCKNCTCKNHK